MSSVIERTDHQLYAQRVDLLRRRATDTALSRDECHDKCTHLLQAFHEIEEVVVDHREACGDRGRLLP